MCITVLILGLMIGVLLNSIIGGITKSNTFNMSKSAKVFIAIICSLSFEILYVRFGFTIILAKAIVLTSILIIISFVDLKFRIIPDFMVMIALSIGLAFSFIVKASLWDTVLGMILGGGMMLILALVPNVMGGGDIKLMFALGAFLGLNRTMWALLLAFIMSSLVSIILLVFKIKGAKDYIPFAPFLSLGSFLSLLIFI